MILGEQLGHGRLVAVTTRLLAAVLCLGLIAAIFDPPREVYGAGLGNGVLYGLTAIGLILVYRTNRIINFAAAGLGAVPGVFAALLVAARGVPFLVAFVVAMAGGAAVGALADVVVVRRFAAAPRLILTVGTLGLVQILAFVAVFVPGWVGGAESTGSVIPTPFDDIELLLDGRSMIDGAQLFAVAVVVVLTAGLAAFFRFTRIGIAVRASSENPDRALLLGVPVRLIGTIAWSVAGLFAGTTIFLRSALIGIPFDGSLGFAVLLYALAAAVVARMERVGLALAAGVGIGILEAAAVTSTGAPDLTSAIMLGVILVALLAQRGALSRAADAGAATLQVVKEYRPVPLELRQLPEVRVARLALGALVALAAVAAPFLVSRGDIGFLTLTLLYAMVAVSLVVLTGWAGQISLGHMGLVGVSAAVASGLAADHDLDFFLVLAAGVAVGVTVSVLVGVPAVRVQGLFLAVTTLAFAGAAQFYLLKEGYPLADALLPSVDPPRVQRPVLWGRVDLADDRTFYFVCLAFLVGSMVLARRFRRSRSGRVFLAVRDNPRAAPAYAVDVVRTRLAAFALSGAVASVAGVLFIYQTLTFDASTFGIGPSVEVFVATAIGGLSSVGGAVAGAVIVYFVKFLGSDLAVVRALGDDVAENISLLVTGPGLLLVLYLFPGGLSQLLFGVRDRFLRWVAARHRLLVPSLVADRRVVVDDDGPDLSDAAASAAEHELVGAP
ncbi:MAG TPA: ABC transporter permease [Acidimicrobiales bacterium]|nr:ABC transporter permease [Acidimicrobiales bacterium]